MTRVVRCPHCLSVLRAQVNARCRCPSCGGYLLVRNPSRAILGPWPVIPRPCRVRDRARQDRPRKSVSSIPRLSRYLSAPERLPQGVPGRGGSPEGQATWARGQAGGGTIIEPSSYPKDPGWEIIDANSDYQLIIDFPYHRDQEIAVETEDGILAIRSLKEDAPSRYHIEFALPPEVVEESLRCVFNNGALILHFDKKKGWVSR